MPLLYWMENSMTVYAMAQIKIINKSKYLEYREVAGKALAKHGGSIIKVGAVDEIIEGPGLDVDAIVIFQFPSKEAALSWKNDPDLTNIHTLRTTGAETNIVLLG